MWNRRSGFTLIELVVVISIIAVLIGILLPALGTARSSAQDLRSKSDLRQLATGYTAYQSDYDGHLMLGYPPEVLYGTPLLVEYAEHTFGPPISRRYPWRLVPYVADVWDVIHSHTDTPPLPQPSDSIIEANRKAYILSVYPSFGLNHVYVGGGDGFGGFVGDTPNYGKHVVFRNDEVRRTSELIVLGESQTNYPQEPLQGMFRLTAPRTNGENWRADGDGIEVLVQTSLGIPLGRFGPNAAMSFFDGHIVGKSSKELEDMRFWANNATTADYDFVP